MARDANTQSYETIRGTLTAIIWQEMQMHRVMRTSRGTFTAIIRQEMQIHRAMRT